MWHKTTPKPDGLALWVSSDSSNHSAFGCRAIT
jgi:hypothetical protein